MARGIGGAKMLMGRKRVAAKVVQEAASGRGASRIMAGMGTGGAMRFPSTGTKTVAAKVAGGFGGPMGGLGATQGARAVAQGTMRTTAAMGGAGYGIARRTSNNVAKTAVRHRGRNIALGVGAVGLANAARNRHTSGVAPMSGRPTGPYMF